MHGECDVFRFSFAFAGWYARFYGLFFLLPVGKTVGFIAETKSGRLYCTLETFC